MFEKPFKYHLLKYKFLLFFVCNIHIEIVCFRVLNRNNLIQIICFLCRRSPESLFTLLSGLLWWLCWCGDVGCSPLTESSSSRLLLTTPLQPLLTPNTATRRWNNILRFDDTNFKCCLIVSVESILYIPLYGIWADILTLNVMLVGLHRHIRKCSNDCQNALLENYHPICRYCHVWIY